jgi:hypothetical protein
MNTIAQPPVIVTSDTTIRVKVIKDSKNIILPKLKSPQQFCIQLHDAWGDYLKSNPKIIEKFDLDNDSINYHSSINLEILQNGKVSGVVYKKWYSKLDSICKRVFENALKKSTWTASYRKQTKTRKYMSTTVKVYFTITKAGLQKVSFDDLKTSQPFFECF